MGIDYKVLGSSIKARRKELKIHQNALANQLEISQGYISDLENGKIPNPTTGMIDKITGALGMNINRLYEVSETTPSFIEEDTAEYKVTKSKDSTNTISNVIDLIKIPILGVVRAGKPMYAEENIVDYTYIEKDKTNGSRIFGLKVVGDSMNMIGIQEGDTIVVKEQPDIEDGEIGIVLIDGEEATIKKVFKTNGNITLMPQSTNPKHQPQIYDINKTEIKIIGKAIEFRRKL
ncbi:MAG: helix-turn-helix domain-containing protein [Deltaproteobacteria bacterium]